MGKPGFAARLAGPDNTGQRNLFRRARGKVAAPRREPYGRRNHFPFRKRGNIRPMLGTILIVILILLLVGALPSWPYSASWGYYPSGGLGLLLIIVLVLVLIGRF